MKILNTIGEVYTPTARKILESLGSVSYVSPTQAELGSLVDDCEIFVVGLGLNFTKEVLEKATRLKVLATATTGLDHIDLSCARERGIEVLSLRGENEFLDTITGTAELAWALMLDLARLTIPAHLSVMNGQWDREKFRGHNLFGKTLGVVGVGRLGKMLVRYGKAFSMRVLATDPNVDVASHGAEAVSFDELVSQSDFVSIHVHLSTATDGIAGTENMFDKTVFGKMKKGAYLINTSRGKIVNEGDLLVALEAGQIAGYGTDVLSDETSFGKTFAKHPLIEYAKSHGNVVVLPHIGGMTYESREATDIFIATKLKNFILKNTNV